MEKKTTTISFRCTAKQKEFIEKKAARRGLSTGNYLLNSALQKKINPYKTIKDRNRIESLVAINESINKIERYSNISDPYLITELTNIKRQGEKAWELL